MKILVTGAGGRVGNALSRFLEQAGHELISWTREQVDFSREAEVEQALVLLEKNLPDVLINCAAISSAETCMDDPLAAHLVNAVAPGILARFCEREQVRLMHFSTDYVLDGRFPGKKSETAKCKPVNIYGESKWEAEQRITENCPSSLIFRVAWVFGNPLYPSFPETVINKALGGIPLEAVEDKFSLPTSLDTINQAVAFFLSAPDASGVYHVCETGEPVSWLDYARTVIGIAEGLGLPLKTCEVHGIKMADLSALRATRPVHTALDNAKLAGIMGNPPPHWLDSLSRYLHALVHTSSFPA